jgi:hypothetical protein
MALRGSETQAYNHIRSENCARNPTLRIVSIFIRNATSTSDDLFALGNGLYLRHHPRILSSPQLV